MRDGRINQKKAPHLRRRAGILFAALLALGYLISALVVPAAYAAEVGQVTLTVRQVFASNGVSPPTGETFTYRLTAQTPNAPMPAGSDAEGHTFTIAGSDEIQIGPIYFSAPGIYIYELSCVTEDRPDHSIDRQVYTIEVHVSADLQIALIIYSEDEVKVPVKSFEHAYGISPSAPNDMPDPPVIKTVNGSPAAASTFSFRLVAENPSNPLPAGSANGVKTITIIGAGRATFGTWSYTQAGTYRYTVSEVNTGTAGYTYDTRVYTITDEVQAADGRLVVTRTVTNEAGEQVTALSFVNTYTPSGTSTTPPPGGGSSSTSSKPDDGPKTGDFSNPTLWMILIAVSGTLLLLLILLGWRCRRKHAER